jgi:hypothetical protein
MRNRIVRRMVVHAMPLVVIASPALLPAQLLPSATTLTVDTNNPVAGSSVSFVLRISAPVPRDSTLVVQLQSSDAALSLPPTVSLRSGLTQVSFSARVGTVRRDTPVTISATAGGASIQTELTVRSLRRVSTLTLAADSILRASSTVGTVTLDQAPWSSETVALSNGGNVSMPSTLVIGAGDLSGTFSISPGGMGDRTITASLNGTSATRTLRVLQDGVISLTLALPYSSAGAGVVMNGTLQAKANSMPPGGVTISLTASPAGILSIPATVVITQPNTPVPFSLTVGTVPSQTTVTITATLNGLTTSVQLVVNP